MAMTYKDSVDFKNDQSYWQSQLKSEVLDTGDWERIDELIQEGKACEYEFPIFKKEDIEYLPEILKNCL